MAGERLRVVEGEAVGTDLPLEDEFVIGRSQEGLGTLGDDPEISRMHARLGRDEAGGLELEDLGSTNGTFLNGTRIRGVRRLQPGDRIRVGRTTLEVLPEVGQGAQPTMMSRLPDLDPAPPARAGAVPPPPPPAAADEHDDDDEAHEEPPVRRPAPERVRAASGARAARGPRPGRRTRRPALLGLAALAAVLGAVGLLVATAGGDEEAAAPPPPRPLNAREILDRGRASTVIVNTRGPARDADGGETVAEGGGSGFVVDAQRGLVVTNAHVVAGQTSIRVGVGGDRGGVNARVVGQAPCEDLALLEMRPVPPGLKTATLGDARRVGAGDRVVALGFPGAFEDDATDRKLQTNEGNVTSQPGSATLGRNLPRLPAVIEHQAPINPGNSGGPLFDRFGRVIGVNTVKSGGEGQSGAISVDRVRALLPDLRQGRDQGYVGWNVQVLKLRGDESVPLVVGVDPNSPGDSAGLKFGDVVQRVDDTLVQDVPDVCEILGGKAIGDRVKVSGLRLTEGRVFQARVRLR